MARREVAVLVYENVGLLGFCGPFRGGVGHGRQPERGLRARGGVAAR